MTRVGQHKHIYEVLDLARCSGVSWKIRLNGLPGFARRFNFSVHTLQLQLFSQSGPFGSRHSAQVVLAIPIFWFQHLFPFEAATDSYDGASK